MATIIQKLVFKNTDTKQLYDLYMDAKLHGHITNGPVKISEKPGSILEVFGGYNPWKQHLVGKPITRPEE